MSLPIGINLEQTDYREKDTEPLFQLCWQYQTLYSIWKTYEQKIDT